MKVTGNIDAQNNPIKNVGVPMDMNDAINAQILQDALRDNGPFEIEYYQVWFHYGQDASPNNTLTIKYRMDGESSFTGNWSAFINQKSLNGWSYNVYQLSVSSDMLIYELKRPIVE